MGAEDNLATVKAVYEAFGRGDVETILQAVAEDVDWAVDAEPVGPWYGHRTGKDGVASFFADIASATDVQDFAVEGMGASDNEVFAFLRFAVRMKTTGREAAFHLHHYFRFGDHGKIEYYRGSEDSAQVERALAG
ncbi:MAG TPA: nuclear transport factor 2 family protein [Solirubrobacteraceae bacterium]|nr:nuclear transport factor 2 family protein [Solirubrobacteraceae bacterium]